MKNFTPPTDVVLAGIEDETAIMDLLRQRHEEDGIGSFDENTVRVRVQRGIFRDGGNIGVIRKNGVIEASIGIFLTQFWYTSNKHLSDYWNFVRPDHRRSTHAKHLIMFAKSYSEALGLPLVMAKISNEKTLPMVRLYQRQLKESGHVFTHNADIDRVVA